MSGLRVRGVQCEVKGVRRDGCKGCKGLNGVRVEGGETYQCSVEGESYDGISM